MGSKIKMNGSPLTRRSTTALKSLSRLTPRSLLKTKRLLIIQCLILAISSSVGEKTHILSPKNYLSKTMMTMETKMKKCR